MDGPRPLRPDEWDQLNALVSAVFRATMFASYPQLFNEENRLNLRVVADGGRVVSHVGMIERPATLAGCRIDVACIGAVATYEEYRGRGYASAAFQDCCDKAAADDVDLMLISGGRGLYRRVGCRPVGQDLDFILGPADLALLRQQPTGERITVARLAAERADDLRALYQNEPVRFLRPASDWRMAFECGVVMARAAEFWGAFANRSLLAYLIVNPPAAMRRRAEDPATLRIAEFAGDRAAIVAALPWLFDQYAAERLTLHVQGSDPILRARLAEAGLAGVPGPTWGTLRVINFPRLMERCRPLLAERLGAAVASALRFEADDRPGSPLGGFTIRQGGQTLRIPDLATLASYLFGSPGEPSPTPNGSAELAGQLGRALPLPSLWYGVTYV